MEDKKFDLVAHARVADSNNPDFDYALRQKGDELLDISNAVPNSEEHRKMVSKSKLPEDEELKSYVDRELEIMGFVAKPVSQANPDGSVQTYWRIALFGPGLKPYVASSSVGVRQSIEYFITERGLGIWDPPIKCKVVIGRTKNNHEFHQLTMID